MAKMQNFELNPNRDKSAVAKLTGQAAQVYHALVEVNRPVTGPELDEHIARTAPFKTRQDTLRVTLYYLVVFKSKGIVLASRPGKPVEENGFAGVMDADGELVAQ